MSVHFLRETGKPICESASKSWTRLAKDRDKGETVVTRNHGESRAETTKGGALLCQTPQGSRQKCSFVYNQYISQCGDDSLSETELLCAAVRF